MRLDISISNSTNEYPKYAQVKNHVEMFGVNILEYTNVPQRFGGIPSVFQLVQTATQKPVSLTKPLQEWWFGLLMANKPLWMARHEVVDCWRNLTSGMKAFTNKTGWDSDHGECAGYADYIQGLNLECDPMKLQPTICHGSTVKIMDKPTRVGGVDVYPVQAINVNTTDLSTLTFSNSPHLIFPAVNWSRCYLPNTQTIDPKYYPHGRAEPFPKLGGNTVPVPLLAYTDVVYIETQWLRPLNAGGDFPANPYWS
jgi:hypothetical protein